MPAFAHNVHRIGISSNPLHSFVRSIRYAFADVSGKPTTDVCSYGWCASSLPIDSKRALERGDGLDFDQELLLDEAVDDQQGVGRVCAIGKQARELAQPPGHEFRDVLRVHEVGGELHDVAPAGAGGFQRLGDLGEGAAALRVERIAGGEHAGDEEVLGRFYARDVRILAERLAERVDVVDLDVRH